MILTCPNCETQYFAQDSTIGEAGRTVKCAACGHSWFVGEGEQAAASGTRTGGAHEAYRSRVRERRERASRRAAIAVWAVSFLVLTGLAGAAVLMRNQVVQTWPQSASAFSALGLKVNRFGMEFVDENAERFLEGTTPVLEITGAVRNFTRQTREAPLIEVRLLDDAGVQIGAYYAEVDPGEIAAGGLGRFVKRVENPPFEAFQLELALAAEGETRPEEAQALAETDETS